jgi:signal transduction histidine kinase
MTMNSELIALLVHDLKNPLAALLSNLGFIESTVRKDEMTHEAVQDCLLSTEALSRLIDNIGTMGALEGSVEQPGESSIAAVFNSVETRMGRHAEMAMFTLKAVLAPDVQAVRCHSRFLELALDNIISTSMSYAPSGSTIQLVSSRVDADTVSLAVIDDGAPIEESVRDLVVRKDGQGALKSAKGGRYARAFGLYIAALVAQTSGGELVLGERDGKSCIELRLPLVA